MARDGENTNSAVLNGNADEFRPGQQHQPSSRGPHNITPRKRRFSKSTAPDIATRTYEDFDYDFYECHICTSEVLPGNKVWSCNTCWTVFRLGCIKT